LPLGEKKRLLVRMFSRDELVKGMQAAGFEIVHGRLLGKRKALFLVACKVGISTPACACNHNPSPSGPSVKRPRQTSLLYRRHAEGALASLLVMPLPY